jgi:hypothetical protein
MNGKTVALVLSGLLGACAQIQPPPVTPPTAPSPPTAAPAATAGPQIVTAAPTAVPPPAGSAAPPAATPSPPRLASVNRVVNIQGATCQGLLNLVPEDRAAAAMFYIGYQASRLRARTINVSVIPSIEAQALTYCQENPTQTITRAFAEAYARASR